MYVIFQRIIKNSFNNKVKILLDRSTFQEKQRPFIAKIGLKCWCFYYLLLKMGLRNGLSNIKSTDFLFHFGNHFDVNKQSEIREKQTSTKSMN